MSFAERYGSYSTDEPTKNLVDLKSEMTDRMAANPLPGQNLSATSTFVGWSTKALIFQMTSLDASGASVVVKTQRAKTGTGIVGQQISYADLQLTMVKSGNNWLVDRAVWK